MLTIPRYRYGARFYDTLSAERFVYRRGRERAIALLRLRPGDRVLVVGCGTGLDLPLLAAAVRGHGVVVGLDKSLAMLAQARRKVERAGWSNITLVQGDAAHPEGVGERFDAVLFSYSLAIIDDWDRAWSAALARVRAGGRVAVLDTDLPTGLGTPLRPLARLALWTGGVDRSRQVWSAVTETLDVPQHERLLHGHIHVAAGTAPGQARPRGGAVG